MISKGCIDHLVTVTDVDSETLTLKPIPNFNEFLYLFPDDLPRILPGTYKDFGIDLQLNLFPFLLIKWLRHNLRN